jgi:glutamate dehydrogenase
MESLGDGPGEIAMSLYQPRAANDNPLRLKLFRAERPIALFEVLPVFENMGLQTEDEHPSRIDRADASQLWLHDFGMDHREGADFDIEPHRKKFRDAFERIWRGEVENDRFNGLVIRAGLDWRQIVVLRACEKYLRQVRALYSQDYVERTMLANPIIARLLVELFEHRFDPDRAPEARDTDALNSAIDVALDAVRLLDEDLILRRFRALIMAMLRTNFYQIGAVIVIRDSHLSSIQGVLRSCQNPARCMKFSSTLRGSKACTCVADLSHGVGYAGLIGARTIERRCWAS